MSSPSPPTILLVRALPVPVKSSDEGEVLEIGAEGVALKRGADRVGAFLVKLDDLVAGAADAVDVGPLAAAHLVAASAAIEQVAAGTTAQDVASPAAE